MERGRCLSAPGGICPPRNARSPLAAAQATALNLLTPIPLSACPRPMTVSTAQQWQADVGSVMFNEADLVAWVDRLASMREDRTHGARASLVYWGTRGLDAETLGDCNTWVAEAEQVA